MTHWFFEVLYKNQEFCQELGKLVLIAGKFETVLKQYLSENGISLNEKKATMGSLVNRLKEHNFLDSNIESHLRDLTFKRNYLMHSLYDLFSYRIEETILERENLVEMDVEMFIYRVRTLTKDFEFFSDIVHEEFTKHIKSFKANGKQ